MNQEINFETIQKRAIKGVIALTGRSLAIQIISLVAIFLLTVFLEPQEYGTFFIVSAVINFFAYFSDIGLAAALIQKKENLKDEDLKTTFTIQQLLVGIIIILIILLTSIFERIYGLNKESIYLLWALSLSLFLSSLKTIPSVLLERRLNFQKLIIPQIVETILFYLTAVYFAWKGFGISSFTLAIVIRSIGGLLTIYIIEPWVPGFSFSKKSLSGLLKFGLPYQLNAFLAVIKDDGLIAFLGSVLGASNMGFLTWAQKWSQAPLRFFMDQVIKVMFPALSRIQNDSQKLEYLASKTLFFICLIVFPFIVGLLIMAPILTEVIPKYEKWQPALIPLYLLSINTFWAAITTPLTNMLNAIGKITTTFKLMVMWTILTWAVVPLMSFNFGINGAAGGFALLGTSSIVAILIARKYINFDLINSVGKPLISSLIMGGLLFLIKNILPVSIFSIFILIFCGMAIYWLVIFILTGISPIKLINELISNYQGKGVSSFK